MKQCQTIGPKRSKGAEVGSGQTIDKFKVVKIKGFEQFKQSPAKCSIEISYFRSHLAVLIWELTFS